MSKIYSFLLASLIGAWLLLGVVILPLLQQSLGAFESYVLLSKIYEKLALIVLFVSAFSLLFELGLLFSRLGFTLKISRLFLSLIALASSLALSYYFLPYLSTQIALGQESTKSELFTSVYAALGLVLKVLLFAQFFLFVMPQKAKS